MKANNSFVDAASPFWSGELDYQLPEGRIAQVPAERREASRLMVLDRRDATVAHARFAELADFLPEGALLVANDSRVFPARLRGHKRDSGGAVEMLLLTTGEGPVAQAMLRVAKPLHLDQVVELPGGIYARIASQPQSGRALVDFSPLTVAQVVERCGQLPLPPYIERGDGPTDSDRERYQTVYADESGSVAAPTAGLHFTTKLLGQLADKGFGFATVTLHVGPGTFVPVRGDVSTHEMEEEQYEIEEEAAGRIAAAKKEGRPVVAVGTTTVRALESASLGNGEVTIGRAGSRLFIRPGHRFQVVDALITNFHLPGSTLLALVMALASRELIQTGYEAAVNDGYRFYSYGDAMLIR